MFFNKSKNIVAFKFFSIGKEQEGINRPALVGSLLELFESDFGELPEEFVIHGPYGIPKGRHVGIKAFKNKLKLKGHEKYYALNGKTGSKLGFEALFEANITNGSYSELVVWFDPTHFSSSLVEIAMHVQTYFPISSGFEIDIDLKKYLISEDKIKKGLLGGVSVEISNEHKQWIIDFQSGAFRKELNKLLLNDLQLKKAQQHSSKIHSVKVGNLNYVECGA